MGGTYRGGYEKQVLEELAEFAITRAHFACFAEDVEDVEGVQHLVIECGSR